ncbi:MAG TPA: Asp-tRNA(Asn)/Glu-tRNA(Gln) amidotransferase GatCAB subunit A [Verrucomicrobiales bacterium]|nr:Asp-tRNA(Asn)/Glu-tRNA(Gln) amidotransferase GatCAB subunit A [Verrucomicrobiales bacterium]
MTTVHSLTINQLIEKLRVGELTSRQIMEACLNRIDSVDDKLNAFISYDVEDALAQADIADKARSEGQEGPLLGVPVAIKDVIAVRNHPLNCASKILGNYQSPYDATVIKKLREAGAIIFGRVNMDEFAMGSSTENSAFGPSRNPWDIDYTPGGSSGGSAVAVSADECIASLGSDTGGSIRQPAALCGCVGLKPSYGRVSRYGLVAFASSLDQIGSFTKDIKDAAIMLQVIAGSDDKDSTSVPEPVPDYTAALSGELKGMRIGLPREYQVDGLDTEVKTATESAVAKLEELGAEVKEISLPHTEYAIATYYIIATAEASANLARFEGVRYGARINGEDPEEMNCKTRGAGFGDEVKRRIILGTYVLSSGYYDAYYLRAQKVRTLIRQDFLKAFEHVDLIATPTTPTPAFKIGEKAKDPLEMYLSDIFTISCNLAGLCGVSLPCGFSEKGLPIGLQLLGRPFGEADLLRAAHVYQEATDWHTKRPDLD